MSEFSKPLTEEEKAHYEVLNRENNEFLMNRYNQTNRWVIADMIRRARYHFPDKKAMIYGDKSLTYREMEDECNRVANALTDLGVGKYDRVAILAHNTIHHVLTWIGCCKIGAVYLAINYLLRGKDISYCINHSESKVFIVEDALYDLVKDVLDEMPTVKTLIWSNQGAGQPPVSERFKDFDSWVKPHPSTAPDTILHIEDPCQMTYTSGTESRPKGVIISNQSLMAHYMGCIIDGQYDSDDVNINALPIYHCAQRDVFMNPMFLARRDQYTHGTGYRTNSQEHPGLQGYHVFCAAHGLDCDSQASHISRPRSEQSQEMLLWCIHYARGNPQGNHGSPAWNKDLQLLRPNGTRTVPHDFESKRCYREARVCRHGWLEHGNQVGK